MLERTIIIYVKYFKVNKMHEENLCCNFPEISIFYLMHFLQEKEELETICYFLKTAEVY